VKNIADWSKEFYVVTVSGLSSSRSRGGGDQETLDSERTERLKMLTVLRVKGKNSISPARIEVFTTPEGRATSFLFSREVAISLDDKELSFETELRSSSIKVKFHPEGHALPREAGIVTAAPVQAIMGDARLEPHPPAAL